MIPEVSSKEKLLQFFRQDVAPVRESALASLRLPAGTFCRQTFSDLNDLELVQFDTQTGIACQGPDEWDVMPTSKGIQILKSIKS